ncbi:MAG: YjjG family noncanonical pyrimidine nucleotidase [Bacteroidales bacterium]|nr:YjjG family noncanonical pyrimidine nucleotidase [Bacteroidales bacterium]MDZ4203849.1 YjjG family noncanonical pyrimidine nucleotidase [Bacteroidales bacterium]
MLKNNYTHIFFDLDHTLWDFDTNTRLTFDEILANLGLYESGIPNIDAFILVYSKHNKALWDQYKKGEIEKALLSYLRFELTLKEFSVQNIGMAKQIAEDYNRISPTKTVLIPGSLEVLEYLRPKYELGLITNGFDEIQFVKIEKAGLNRFFKWVVTSEEAGAKKPDPAIFYYTLQKTGANAETSLYIGDEPDTDIPGALLAGIDQILLCDHCPEHTLKATHTIACLRDLLTLL